ncbi:TetR/AcrR family transcriptional regulator [Pseudonocardia pini]|uniref:TetR/AcrR family transcriptional regulator n=1 Tax=Pseudonocardia pini TaxID=2758030 RepID=UPI0015EFE61D|nr:TetR/AcrR family transcriptional regulator [Pseudonocardia pini]
MRTDIIDAAARLLQEQGVRAVTTRAVAEAAGVQAPTIYRLFGDKDGLIDAVAEHVMATYVATKTTEAADDPVAELRAGWRVHIEFGVANPDLFRLLHTSPRPSPATAAGIDVLRRRIRRLAAAGLLRVDEQRALDMIHAAGTGTVFALLATPPGERDPGLADALFDAVCTGLLTTTAPARDDGVATAAVTFLTVLADLPALTDAERALMAEWLTRSLARLRNP